MYFEIVPILFLIFGFLSPLYNKILRNNLSNEKGFLIVWGIAPFIVSYAYVTKLFILIFLVFLNILTILLVLKERYTYIWNGIIFLITGFIMELFYKIL